MPRTLQYQKCLHIIFLQQIANIPIKLSMNHDGTFNIHQTTELQCSAVAHPIRIITGIMQDYCTIMISITALK